MARLLLAPRHFRPSSKGCLLDEGRSNSWEGEGKELRSRSGGKLRVGDPVIRQVVGVLVVSVNILVPTWENWLSMVVDEEILVAVIRVLVVLESCFVRRNSKTAMQVETSYIIEKHRLVMGKVVRLNFMVHLVTVVLSVLCSRHQRFRFLRALPLRDTGEYSSYLPASIVLLNMVSVDCWN